MNELNKKKLFFLLDDKILRSDFYTRSDNKNYNCFLTPLDLKNKSFVLILKKLRNVNFRKF